MTITLIDGLFVATASYDERLPLKAAGFRFCGGKCDPKFRCARCRDARREPAWYTDRQEIAARLLEHCDDAAKQALQATAAKQSLSAAATTDFRPPAPAGLTYRDFQRAGIEFVHAHVWPKYKGALIGDDMGLGKTIQALGLVNVDQSIRRVLVLCPKSLQINWLREADRWLLPKQEPWRVYLAEETAPVPPEANLVIVNYDKLVGKPGLVVAPSLVQEKWDLIVMDEAHYLKNPKAQRTQVALQGLRAATRRLLFLTGTPIENKPIEIQPIVEACAPEEFPFWQFAKRFCDAHEEWVGKAKKRVWKFDGHSNLEELNARLRGTVMVRRLKTDVLKELPAKVRQVVELPSGDAEELIREEGEIFRPHEEAITAAMALDLAGTGEDGYAGAVASLSSKVSAAFGELARIRHDLGVRKVEPALEWITDALDGGVAKMVVFAHHHDVIDLLEKGLEEYSPVRVDGRVDSADRQAAVDGFQADPSTRVFIGQTSAAGVGITLTAASTVAFVESDWVPGKITQAEDRCHRIGQTDSVNVYHLVFDGSLDARMLQTVLEKQAVQDAALDSEVRVKVEATGAALTGTAGGASVAEGEPPKKVWPKATDEERAAAKAALRYLSEACDNAVKKDGAGFSKVDVRIGKELAARRTPLTDGQVFVAKRLARKYQRQLPAELKGALLGGAA